MESDVTFRDLVTSSSEEEREERIRRLVSR